MKCRCYIFLERSELSRKKMQKKVLSCKSNWAFGLRGEKNANSYALCKSFGILLGGKSSFKGSLWNFETYKFSLDSSNENLQLYNFVELPLKPPRYGIDCNETLCSVWLWVLFLAYSLNDTINQPLSLQVHSTPNVAIVLLLT